MSRGPNPRRVRRALRPRRSPEQRQQPDDEDRHEEDRYREQRVDLVLFEASLLTDRPVLRHVTSSRVVVRAHITCTRFSLSLPRVPGDPQIGEYTEAPRGGANTDPERPARHRI